MRTILRMIEATLLAADEPTHTAPSPKRNLIGGRGLRSGPIQGAPVGC